MPPQMIPCPHCGTANSDKKQVCYHCHAAMKAPAPSGRVGRNKAALPRRQRMHSQPKSGRESHITLAGASLKDRAQFYRQMYSLLNSGIPVGLSLSSCADNSAFLFRSVLRRLSEHVMAGGVLSEAMLGYPTLFPFWEVTVIGAAEKSGTLPKAMSDIAQALEDEWNLRSRTFAATIHLWATLFVFILVALILSSIQPGSVTAVLDNVGMAFLKFAFIVLGFFAARHAWRLFARSRTGAAFLAVVIPRVPLLGPIWRDTARIRFVRTLAALWHAGVAPLEAIEVATRTTNDQHFIRQITEKLGQFSQGATLASIIEPTKFLPPEALYLLQTGESTGDVSQSLERVAEYFDIELQAKVKTLPAKLQLLFYAIIIPLVFFLAISFYMGRANDMMSIFGD